LGLRGSGLGNLAQLRFVAIRLVTMFKSGSCVFLLAPGELSSEQTFEYITVYLLSWLKGEKSNLALAQPNEPFSGSCAKETKKNREPTSCCHPLIDISTIHLNV